jgi:RNA polymerase sigma factor (sigma-70 family)
MSSDLIQRPTRASLLELAKSGADHLAWEELLTYYEPFIQRVLVAMGVRPDDIQDVAQLVLMRLWKDLKHYQYEPERARFRTWLSRLIRNAAVDRFREMKRERSFVSVELIEQNDFLLVTSEVEMLVEEEWRANIVRLALMRLNEMFSGNAIEVFLLSLEGETSENISTQLGLSKESVYVLKHRVKKRFTEEVILLRREMEYAR